MDASPAVFAPTSSEVAQILARLWSRPSPAELERWRQLAREHPQVIDQLLGVNAGVWLDNDDAVTLCAEYDRRIEGPNASPAPPYESLWRDDVPLTQRHGTWPPALTSLRRIYARLRLASPPAARIDEITVELDAVATALSDESTAWLARLLVEEHLARWLPDFLEAVARISGQPFYRRLASATSLWLTAIRADLAEGPMGPPPES